MSIQSSINQMLSSITNDKLYGNIYKSLKNTETNIGDINPQLDRLQKQVQRANRRNATERYKQAIAEGIARNQRTQQLTPDNAAETAKPEDSSHLSDTTVTDYVDKSIDPNELQQVSETILEHGSIKDLVEDARYGRQMIDDEIKLREEYPDIDNISEKIFKDLSNTAQTQFKSAEELRKRITNIAQTRVNMERILAEDTQNAVTERYEQSKGGAQK